MFLQERKAKSAWGTRMGPKVKVTVGMCIRNCEAYIKEAIASVLEQDFPHDQIEVIVVDDGSEDKTLPLVSDSVSGADIVVRVFHHEWKGLGPSRNVVVNNAKGKYVVWVDCDNLLPTDHVRKQVDFMERNPRVGIAAGKFKSRPESNLISSLESIEWEVNYHQGDGETASGPLGHFCGGGGGSIYRVSAIRQVGGFDSNIKGAGEDFDVERKITGVGWLLYFPTEAEFYHRCKKSLKSIWKENYWYGYGGHYLAHKGIKKVTPVFALMRINLYLFLGYRLTRRKVAFLFPFQQILKKVIWTLGFWMAHLDGYGHDQNILR